MPEITWDCVSCGFEIADGEGWVHAPMSEVHKHESAPDEWEAANRPTGGVAVTLGQVMDYPDPAQWQAVHDVCDASGGEPYAIEVEKLRTPWDLIEWTVQLIEKSWIRWTDWGEVLRAKHNDARGRASEA